MLRRKRRKRLAVLRRRHIVKTTSSARTSRGRKFLNLSLHQPSAVPPGGCFGGGGLCFRGGEVMCECAVMWRGMMSCGWLRGDMKECGWLWSDVRCGNVVGWEMPCHVMWRQWHHVVSCHVVWCDVVSFLEICCNVWCFAMWCNAIRCDVLSYERDVTLCKMICVKWCNGAGCYLVVVLCG